MRTSIQGYEIEIQLEDETSGLPDRILIRSSDLDNPNVWIYTRTKTVTYDTIPKRLVTKGDES